MQIARKRASYERIARTGVSFGIRASASESWGAVVKRAARVPTSEQILKAARTVLSRDGLAALSTRAVATEAGVNLSLIHYYYGSRDGLLLALLHYMTSELTERQQHMYTRPDLTFAEKWAQATDFYRQDLKSGYVRAMHELESHAWSSPAIAAEVNALNAAWVKVLTDVAADALRRLGVSGVKPQEVAAMIVAFWGGMEDQHLLGISEEDIPLWQATEKIGKLIERLERRSKRRA